MFFLIIKRIAWMFVLLVVVNIFSFAYAHYGRYIQLAAHPMIVASGGAGPFWPKYEVYIQSILNQEKLVTPFARGVDLLAYVQDAAVASLGLLGIAFTLSLLVGALVGWVAAQTNPPRIAAWLIPVTTVSLAMPGFYIGASLITGSVYYLLYTPATQQGLLFPIRGFGWDLHLVFPLIALTFRPAVQIAQTAATLLTEEFKRNYVSAARSFGHSWQLIRRKTALRNIFAPLAQTVASSLRLMVGEIILVEWLFGWPGLGKMLAQSLQPPTTAHIASAVLPPTYLDAPTVATLITVIAAILITADIVANIVAHQVDPRMQIQNKAVSNG